MLTSIRRVDRQLRRLPGRPVRNNPCNRAGRYDSRKFLKATRVAARRYSSEVLSPYMEPCQRDTCGRRVRGEHATKVMPWPVRRWPAEVDVLAVSPTWSAIPRRCVEAAKTGRDDWTARSLFYEFSLASKCRSCRCESSGAGQRELNHSQRTKRKPRGRPRPSCLPNPQVGQLAGTMDRPPADGKQARGVPVSAPVSPVAETH